MFRCRQESIHDSATVAVNCYALDDVANACDASSVCFLVGIDDTDNTESRGTGYRARQLGEVLTRAGMQSVGITRHQLFVDARIPYTSHNSSACLAVTCDLALEAELARVCRQFLSCESAPGSDAGLCIARRDRVSDEVMTFGRRAKVDVLAVEDAQALGRARDFDLVGLTGTGGGVIGALSAVGLRAGGNDGRFIWLRGLRELRGVHTVEQLGAQVPLDAIETEAGRVPGSDDRIAVGDWPRPIMRAGRVVLVVEETRGEQYEWIGAAKPRIKALSE